MIFEWIWNMIYLCSGIITYSILLRRRYNSNIRVFLTALTIWLGPMVLLSLIFMKGRKVNERSFD